ncbi:MAG: hypothetical protein GY926_22770 [bacterium]|nr:hypothetical protein [bacterium]
MIIELLVAGLFAAGSWAIGIPPHDYQFYGRWLRARYVIIVILSLVANLAAAGLGYVVVSLLDWPSAEDTHAIWRGLAMAGIGQAAVRVQFTKLPSAGAGITFLGSLIGWINKLRDLWLKTAVMDALEPLTAKQLALAARNIIGEHLGIDSAIEGRAKESFTNDLTETVKQLKSADHEVVDDAITSLRSTLRLLIARYTILRRTIEGGNGVTTQ